MMHRGLVSTLVLATILADGNAVRAQVTGGILPGGTCEAGLMYHDINRAIEFQNVMKDVTYSTSTIVFRFGITDAATVSMELGGGMGSVDIDDFSYVVGGSVQTRMWSREPTRVTTTIAFTRILSLYRETGSPGGSAHAERGLERTAGAGRSPPRTGRDGLGRSRGLLPDGHAASTECREHLGVESGPRRNGGHTRAGCEARLAVRAGVVD